MHRYRKQTALLHERKALMIRELKINEDEPGVFEGYLSVFGNTDQGDDVVVKGAFAKTLREAKERQTNTGARYLFPILWMHDENQPIGGFLQATEDEHGLFVRGELDLDTESGRDKYSGLKKGYINEMSIGYAALQKQYRDGLRYLKEVRLYEGSLITQGAAMNPEALVTAVKKEDAMNGKGKQRAAAKAADFNAAYMTAQDDLQEQWHDAFVGLVQTVYGILSDESDADHGATIAESISQFAAVVDSLADRSQAAGFVPCLDWDNDSFADSTGNDVYGVETDDDSPYYGYSRMSADHEDGETKKGAAMSAANHDKMAALLKTAQAGQKQMKSAMAGLVEMHKSLTPPSVQADEDEYESAASGKPVKSRAGADEERATTHDADIEDALAAFAAALRR